MTIWSLCKRIGLKILTTTWHLSTTIPRKIWWITLPAKPICSQTLVSASALPSRRTTWVNMTLISFLMIRHSSVECWELVCQRPTNLLTQYTLASQTLMTTPYLLTLGMHLHRILWLMRFSNWSRAPKQRVFPQWIFRCQVKRSWLTHSHKFWAVSSHSSWFLFTWDQFITLCTV